MKVWRIITVLLLCLVLVGSTACNPFASSNQDEVSQQLVKVERGDLILSVSGSTNVDVSHEARLAFGSGGKVDKIHVNEGDKVTEGKVLAKLDTGALELALTQAQVARTQAQVALTQAQVALQTAEYNLEEAQDLYAESEVHMARAAVHEAENYLEYAQSMLEKSKIARDIKTWTNEVDHAREKLRAAEVRLNEMLTAPDTEEVAIAKLQVEAAKQSLELARQSLELTQQSLEQAQKQLDEATIAAPFDGIVAKINAKEGDIIPPPTMAPTEIIHLIDPSSMELKAEVDEIDIPSVKPNQRAIIEVDALPDIQLEGKVTSISLLPKVEAGVIVYEVKISLDVPQDLRLKVGMSATADIIIDERSNVLLVPDRTIKLDSQGNPVVKVMVDEQIQERSVVVGISDGYQTEIVDGLQEGDVVVIEKRVKKEPGGLF